MDKKTVLLNIIRTADLMRSLIAVKTAYEDPERVRVYACNRSFSLSKDTFLIY